MKAVYYNQVRQEKDKVSKTAFWNELWTTIGEVRETAVNHCVQDGGDISFYQGQVRAFDIMFDLPDRIMKKLKANAQQGIISSEGETPEG